MTDSKAPGPHDQDAHDKEEDGVCAHCAFMALAEELMVDDDLLPVEVLGGLYGALAEFLSRVEPEEARLYNMKVIISSLYQAVDQYLAMNEEKPATPVAVDTNLKDIEPQGNA